MPVMWMEMTEQMKTGGSKYRRKSRKSRGKGGQVGAVGPGVMIEVRGDR